MLYYEFGMTIIYCIKREKCENINGVLRQSVIKTEQKSVLLFVNKILRRLKQFRLISL